VLPAPADPDKFLTATYGPSWRVPDPAFHFETPESTHRRLNGWFRGTRVRRAEWDRAYSGHRLGLPDDLTQSSFADWVADQEGVPETLVDLGCGRGVDDLWFARRGTKVIGLDYVIRGSDAVGKLAAADGLDLEFRPFNLLELRSVLAEGTRVARLPGPRVVTARHIADATDRVGRANLWRTCEMMLRGGGRLYLEFLVRRGVGDGFARKQHLRTLPVDLVVAELEGRGASIVSRKVRQEDGGPTTSGRRIGRLVVEWHR
jgi:SAM-dependent methyltransferase